MKIRPLFSGLSVPNHAWRSLLLNGRNLIKKYGKSSLSYQHDKFNSWQHSSFLKPMLVELRTLLYMWLEETIRDFCDLSPRARGLELSKATEPGAHRQCFLCWHEPRPHPDKRHSAARVLTGALQLTRNLQGSFLSRGGRSSCRGASSPKGRCTTPNSAWCLLSQNTL